MAGRWWSLVPSPRCWLQVACKSLSARLLCAPYCPSAFEWSACKALWSQLSLGSLYMGLPHHQQGVPSVWLWMSRARVLSCAQPRPCWALVSFRYCIGWDSWVWWVCEGLNLMDQRVLTYLKVALWLTDRSPVESHPLCSLPFAVLLNVLRVALSCRFAVVLASPCRACSVGVLKVLRVASSAERSACQRRRVRRARRRCCSRASWPLLVRRYAHAAVLCSTSFQC